MLVSMQRSVVESYHRVATAATTTQTMVAISPRHARIRSTMRNLFEWINTLMITVALIPNISLRSPVLVVFALTSSTQRKFKRPVKFFEWYTLNGYQVLGRQES